MNRVLEAKQETRRTELVTSFRHKRKPSVAYNVPPPSERNCSLRLSHHPLSPHPSSYQCLRTIPPAANIVLLVISLTTRGKPTKLSLHSESTPFPPTITFSRVIISVSGSNNTRGRSVYLFSYFTSTALKSTFALFLHGSPMSFLPEPFLLAPLTVTELTPEHFC